MGRKKTPRKVKNIGIGTITFGRLDRAYTFESFTLSGFVSGAGSGSAGERAEGLQALHGRER